VHAERELRGSTVSRYRPVCAGCELRGATTCGVVHRSATAGRLQVEASSSTARGLLAADREGLRAGV
jgi:hypothetical protein